MCLFCFVNVCVYYLTEAAKPIWVEQKAHLKRSSKPHQKTLGIKLLASLYSNQSRREGGPAKSGRRQGCFSTSIATPKGEAGYIGSLVLQRYLHSMCISDTKENPKSVGSLSAFLTHQPNKGLFRNTKPHIKKLQTGMTPSLQKPKVENGRGSKFDGSGTPQVVFGSICHGAISGIPFLVATANLPFG